MSTVAFLASVVDPRVASAAAKAALGKSSNTVHNCSRRQLCLPCLTFLWLLNNFRKVFVKYQTFTVIFFKAAIQSVRPDVNSNYSMLILMFLNSFCCVLDEFGNMKEEIPMAVLEARVKKAAEEMESELKVEGKETGLSSEQISNICLSNKTMPGNPRLSRIFLCISAEVFGGI